jgi:Mrp family chromosome partitioning ATPase
MACGFETIAEFAQCAILVKEFLATARPWIELGLSLLGIGTVGLLAVLTWALKKHRHDIERLQSTEEALRSASKRAMEAQADAEGRAARSEQNLVRALDELSLVRAPIDAQLAEAKSTIAALQSKLDLVRNASCDNEEFWSREPDTAKRMPDYIGRLSRSIPVLLFANQKGGVGKTTLATNVAACFAERGERVLVIDLDYQGSATSLMLAQASERRKRESENSHRWWTSFTASHSTTCGTALLSRQPTAPTWIMSPAGTPSRSSNAAWSTSGHLTM